MNRIYTELKEHWSPKPISPPAVDPELEDLNGVQRSAEVFRYSVLSIEWWLSPNGTLREWFKLNGKVGSILLMPAVLILPLVCFIIWQILSFVAMLVSLAGKLVVFPIAAFIAACVIKGVVTVMRTLFR